MKLNIYPHIIIGFTALVLAGSAAAERYVVVNAQRLSMQEIAQLERAHCGPVPNGHYWLDYQTGMWGYAGDGRAQGHISDNCYSPERRPGLSERGMLFAPGELAR
jgi:hypothetical protein